MINASIILDTRRETKIGYPIKIRVRSGNKSKYISLNLYSKKNNWSGNNVLKSHPKYRQLHLKLNKRQVELSDQIAYCNNNKLSFENSIQIIINGVHDINTEILLLKQRLKKLQNQSSVKLLEFFDVRIVEKEKINQSTSLYKSVKSILKTYLNGKDISLNDITYEWLNDFITYKLEHGTNRGGVNGYLSTIKAVYKEAQRRKSLNIKTDNPFIGLIKQSATKKKIKLNYKDFKKLKEYTPKKGSSIRLANIRKRNIAVWLFQFYIGGHDFVDISLLKWSDINNNRVVFRRYKNRNKGDGGIIIDNKLFPVAQQIIDKYGVKSSKRIFSFIPDPKKEEKKYAYYRYSVGNSIASISEKLKLTNHIKTKSPRYLFRTISGEMQIDYLIVMQLQGHKPQGVTFNYQNRLPNKMIDVGHKKIINSI